MRKASVLGRPSLASFTILCLSAISCLYLIRIDLGRIHLLGLDHTLNDQAVYIDAARQLRDDGRLSAGAYYPSTLLQDYGRNYLYMPGHAAVLSISISLLGDRPFAVLAPGLLSYMLCVTSLVLLCRKHLGPRAEYTAVAGFMAFPPFLVYAASAMAEMTFLASGAVAYTVFSYLPPHRRHLFSPLLVAVPFLFRETGIVWLIPIVSSLLAETGLSMKTRLSRATISVLGSSAVLAAVMSTGVASDRPSLFTQNLYGDSFEEKYTSAVALDTTRHEPGGIAGALARRAWDNTGCLFELLTTPSTESLFLHAVLWTPLAWSFLSWRNRRNRHLVASWVLMSTAFILSISLFYRWDTMIGLRHMLTPAFMGLLVIAGCADRLSVMHRFWIRAASACVLVTGSLLLYNESGERVTEWDRAQDKAITVMAEAGVPEGGVLISDVSLGPVYLYSHPGSGWLLPPSDEPTLRLAAKGSTSQASSCSKATGSGPKPTASPSKRSGSPGQVVRRD